MFADAGFKGGSFYSEYVEDEDADDLDKLDTICTTFRFQGQEDDGSKDGALKRPMPQKSLMFTYKDCPSDVPTLHDWVQPNA